MAWTAPRTWVVGEVLTAALLNTHLRDNMLETAVAKAASAGMQYSSAANALAHLAASGNGGKFLRFNAGATAVEAAVTGATYAYKSATQVLTTTTTFADVTASSGNLAFAIAANEVWAVRYVVPLSFGGTGGIKFQITGPSTPTAVSIMGWVANVARADAATDSGQATESFPVVTAFSAAIISLNSSNGLSAGTINYANTNPLVEIIALIANGANAGTVTLQAAQNNANSTTTLGIGTHMRAERVA